MLLGRDLAQNLVLGAGSAAKIQGDLATDPGVFGSTGFGDGPERQNYSQKDSDAAEWMAVPHPWSIGASGVDHKPLFTA